MSALIKPLEELVPSAFSVAPVAKASDKFKMVRTIDLVQQMENHGWEVVSAKELRTTSSLKMGNQYHAIKMQNTAFDIGKDEKFQITISNGADCVTPLIIQASIYRLVCSNGLMAGKMFIPPIRLTHVGNVQEIAHQAMEQLPPLMDVVRDNMDRMKSAPVSKNQMIALAEQAYLLRHSEVKDQKSLEDLVTSHRKIDESMDLWTQFNVIQENLINGLYSYPVMKANKIPALYKATKIESIKKDIQINQKLFDLALGMIS